MERSSSIKDTSRKDVIKLAITIIVLIAPEVMSYYAVKVQTLPLIVLRFFIVLGIILISSYARPALINRPNFTRRNVVLCFILMLITSVFHVNGTMPLLTLLTIGYLMPLGTISKRIDIEVLNKSLMIVVCVFIPLLIYQLLHTSFDMASILRRGLTWSEIFYYATLTTIWPIFLFSSILLKRNLILAIVYWFFAIALNLLSLKKAVFVDSAIVFSIIAYVCLKIKDKETTKYLLLVGIPVIAGVIYYISNMDSSADISEMLNAVGNRFEEDSETGVGSNNRVQESITYFTKEANFFDIIFGKGILSSHYALEDEHYFLHIGWMNWIFKGGLFLFFTILLSYKRVFYVFKSPQNYSTESVFASMYCMYYFFTLFYVNYMGFGIELFLFFYCLTLLNERNVPKKIPQTLL